MSAIGREAPLEDGRPKVAGSLRFCADLTRPGMLHARLVLSPHAHATVDAIDVEQALATEGVSAVLTAADLPEIPPRSRPALLLARDRVLFAGHPVALVLAESEAAAQDGADAVYVEYTPRPAVLDIEAALAPDAPAVWPGGGPGQSEEAAAHGAGGGGEDERVDASPNEANRVAFERGELETGFAEADEIVEHTYRTSAVHQSYLEPHVTLIDPDPITGELRVYTSTQAAFYVRDSIAAMLRMESGKVRVIATPVGGGFGGKFVLYEPLLALAVAQLGRPVRLVLTRLEEMLAANPAAAMRIRLKLGGKRDGTLTALDAEMAMDNGCFPSSMTGLAGVLLGSNYTVPNQRVVGYEVLTHKPSGGAYRAPCAPQCAFALETALDELAARLGVDPLELRHRNAAAAGDAMAIGRPWPTIGLREVLDKLAAHPAWKGREAQRATGRGVGIAVAGWPGGTEPAAAACGLDSDGTLKVEVGSVDLTGTTTGLKQIAAEAFGLELEQVRLVTGDTETAPFAGATGGSKIIYTLGPAVIQAVEEVKRQTLELASQELEAAPEDLEIADGKVRVKGAPDSAIPLAKLARKTMTFGSQQAPLFAHGRHAQRGPAPGFCAQLAEVEVDRETGAVRLHRLVVIQDAGRAVNPAMVRGQMSGGAVQGLGWGLLEQMRWDDGGQLVTATFADYAVPKITDAPDELDLEIVEVASDSGPFGARGVGEPPVIATAAAIANAVADATGGLRLTDLPLSAPSVLAALGHSSA